MPSRIRIFDHFCKQLTEIVAPTTPRGWVLNGYSRCEFSVSTSDPKCTEMNLQYGNLVYIEHLPSGEGKLPDWVGMILPNRDWDYGVVHVNAYSAESVLGFRAMPFVPVSGTPKEVFLNILDYARQAASNIVVQPGVIDDLPQFFPDDLTLTAYDHIGKLCEHSGMDWDVTGQIDSRGSLQLFANLYSQRGIETDLTLTNLNSEISSPMLSEQGTPTNHVFGYAQASTPQTRYRGEGKNQSAIDDYGPLQTNRVFTGKHDPSSVAIAAQNKADERGRPVKMIHRVVLDKGTAFSKLDIGNILTIKDTSVGFSSGGGFGMDARVKIYSMDYNDLTNKVPLNVRVV